MSAVGQVADRTERPAYVRFERRPVQDHAESLKQGKHVDKDVDYVIVTPPYSKDAIPFKVETWLANMRLDVQHQRLPPEWLDKYVDAYERFKRGEEMPVIGTPIKGWGVLSPAQQTNLIRIDIRTVEDLAGVNAEGLQRIGMGATDLKNKAVAWLAQLHDKGPLTLKVADLERGVAAKDGQIASLMQKVELLQRDLRVAQMQMPAPAAPVAAAPAESITAEDILSI